EAYLAAQDFHFPQLEQGGGDASVDALLGAQGVALSDAAVFILRGVLEQVREDAAALSLGALQAAIDEIGVKPVTLARRLAVPVALMLRRLAALPSLGGGLVVCDRSGTVIFRKTVDGFSVPRFDSCCPLWPLFAALAAPGSVLRERVGQLGRGQMQFDAFATTELATAYEYNTPVPARGVMLLLPAPAGDASMAVRAVGATCRICPHERCHARREPSIMR
ncbi:MAG: short-chain fatty acyl-CoA regulator family protein, partial [Sulfitobacter sp.]|nr:short-chain fatty acyl-CoA regulator family protein [Sulfitobacter sp.]